MRNPKNFCFHPAVVVRVPRLPNYPDFDQTTIRKWLQDPNTQEAIRITSNAFFDELKNFNPDEVSTEHQKKIMLTLVKYFIRMTTRSTPFGLFAASGVVQWSSESEICVDDADFKKNIKISTDILSDLAQAMTQKPEISQYICYRINNTFHKDNHEYRYIYKQINHSENTANYSIAKIDVSDFFDDLVVFMKNQPILCKDILDFLKSKGFDERMSEEIFRQLTESQVLVNDLLPSPTQASYQSLLIDKIKDIPGAAVVSEGLQEIKQLLGLISEEAVAEYRQDLYEKCEYALKKIIDKDKIFHVDTFYKNPNGKIAKSIQKNLAEGIEILGRICSNIENKDLELFKKIFSERYENRFVPLMEVMDIDLGIGYPISNAVGQYSELFQKLSNSDAEVQDMIHISRDKIYQYLYDKLQEAEYCSLYEVSINPSEIESFPEKLSLPPSASVVFKVVSENEIFLEGISGSSGLNLIGRVAHLHDKIGSLAQEIVEKEEILNSDVIFAEIVYLPNGRIANVMMRHPYRKYEIPYLSTSTVEDEFTISPADLYVGIRQNKIILHSQKHNKEIIPRLSTAHNYITEQLPIYRFLCDLQLQNLNSNLHFDWRRIEPQETFYPRLRYKNIILYPASWYFKKKHLKEILNIKDKERTAALSSFFLKWKIPQFFIWAEGDRELVINQENPLSVNAWLDSIRNSPEVRLKEDLFQANSNSIVKNTDNQPYRHEFIATLLREDTTYKTHFTNFFEINQNVKRAFEPGSQWLYIKIYSSVNDSDSILLNAIAPMTSRWKENQQIKEFFFVRYKDIDTHLRVRFLLTDEGIKNFQLLLREANQTFDSLGLSNRIRKIQIETYQRELERYGIDNIEQTESLFSVDSECCVEILNFIKNNNLDENHRFISGIMLIDAYLNDSFGLTTEKLGFVTKTHEYFSSEFLNPQLRKELSNHYRENKHLIAQAMGISEEEDSIWIEIRKIINKYANARKYLIEDIAKRNENFDFLLASYIHMAINRLILSGQRFNEFVMYDFLIRQYATIQAFQKKNLNMA